MRTALDPGVRVQRWGLPAISVPRMHGSHVCARRWAPTCPLPACPPAGERNTLQEAIVGAVRAGAPQLQAQVVEWVLAGMRAEWASPGWQAHLASPQAFMQRYIPVTPDSSGGWQVGSCGCARVCMCWGGGIARCPCLQPADPLPLSHPCRAPRRRGARLSAGRSTITSTWWSAAAARCRSRARPRTRSRCTQVGRLRQRHPALARCAAPKWDCRPLRRPLRCPPNPAPPCPRPRRVGGAADAAHPGLHPRPLHTRGTPGAGAPGRCTRHGAPGAGAVPAPRPSGQGGGQGAGRPRRAAHALWAAGTAHVPPHACVCLPPCP